MKSHTTALSITLALCNQLAQAVVFQGLIESGISKNNFSCPNTSSSSIPCNDPTINAAGFNLHDKPTLQIFNDQPYWLHQEALAAQYATESLTDTGSQVQNYLNSNGWAAIGGFCIVITVDPILANFVAPNLKPTINQERLVVQLWYNGDNSIELWSQDVQLVSKEANFKVVLSSAVDPLPKTTDSDSQKNKFLKQMQLQPSNRKESVYSLATESPRSVKIQEQF